ncbi:hypothetical protein GGR56DRAFT_630406 [Xylariaceae sp. FL0804]|nr:hypothetical protein GGR56DRAFT_630406 [Xylariaceae sp. FL0804]
MSPRYDEAPELAPHNYPEVHQPPTVPEVATSYPQFGAPPYKPTEDSATVNTAYTAASPGGHYAAAPAPVASSSPDAQYGGGGASSGYFPGGGPGSIAAGPPSTAGGFGKGRGVRRVCGCTVAVFVLSLIIALLSVAVVGLAAGTGVESSRANDAETQLAAVRAQRATVTVTATAPGSTSTAAAGSTDSLSEGCANDANSVSGTTYTTYFFNRQTYKIFCNSNTPNSPLQSLFVGDFADCMDACASYSDYAAANFPDSSNSANVTCAGVSFVPAWTNRTFADDGNAPGNCYLKPGPQNSTALTDPDAGSATHSAILDD